MENGSSPIHYLFHRMKEWPPAVTGATLGGGGGGTACHIIQTQVAGYRLTTYSSLSFQRHTLSPSVASMASSSSAGTTNTRDLHVPDIIHVRNNNYN